MDREVKVLVRRLAGQTAFVVRRTRKGHFQVSKNGRVVTVIPGTPSDWRSLRNSRADLRRAGYQSA